MKIHIQLNYGLDADAYAERYAAGLAPDLAPYGFHHARSLHEAITFSRDRRGSPIWSLLRRALAKALGFDLLHAWQNREAIFAADVVWTMIESDYLAVAALCLVTGRHGAPAIIGNNVWLFECADRLGVLRRWLYHRLIERVNVITVHSRDYLPIAATFVPNAQVELMYFGVSGTTFLQPASQKQRHDGPIRILAAGNDPTRDWPTLLKAFGGNPHFELVIVSDKVSDEAVARYTNVRLPRRPTIAAFKELYLWADFAVVPMIENKYSGITVAQEAAACGCCVVSSHTGGVPTYFDEDEVLYCRVGDPDDMRRVVLECDSERRHAVAERGHRRFVHSGYTTERMIQRYHEISREILAGEQRGSASDSREARGDALDKCRP